MVAGNGLDARVRPSRMAMPRQHRYVLAGLLVAVLVLTAAVLWEVVEVVFFAITVAYVLFPLRQRLVDRGVPRRARPPS